MIADQVTAVPVRRAPTQNRARRLFRIGSFAACAALALLPLLLKLDGQPHADWQQFLGRFHPLIVHLPIGMLVLLPLLEVAGRRRPALREAAGFVLSLSVVSCMAAASLGYLLAYGSGDVGAGVLRHMWGGIALTAGAFLCLLLRPAWISGGVRGLYPALLGCLLLLLAWTAHQGGSLTHGANYLTEYLPASLKRWSFLGLGKAKTHVLPGSFYAQHIDPIFDANCVVCHGDAKVKGGLRLDSYELLMEGGKDGRVIVSGHPEQSDLFERITLSPDHKKFMPAEGKPPLKPEEIALIRAWIAQGASPTATSLVGVVLPREHRAIVLPQVGDYRALMPAIEQMDKIPGATLIPVSRNLGDGLILNAAPVAAKFGDAQLGLFRKYAPYIVVAELGRTGITDASLPTLAGFTHLRELHLEGTAITGVGLAQLTQLHDLEYVNLSGAKVTKASIAPLMQMKNLHHLYLYNTPAQPAPAPAPATAAP